MTSQQRPAPDEASLGRARLVAWAAALGDVLRDLLAIAWPVACVSCGIADRELCRRCWAEARSRPLIVREQLPPVIARGPYDGPVRSMLVAYKHSGRTVFARRLAELLRDPLSRALVAVAGSSAPIVVTVPSRRARVRQRGYQHMEVLVARALRRGGAPVLFAPVLRATRGRVGQVGLSAAERERNARRIAVKRHGKRLLRGRRVVLVDDIVTTGATVNAARIALEREGAIVVSIVALCVAERRDTHD